MKSFSEYINEKFQSITGKTTNNFEDKILQVLRNYGSISINKNRADEVIDRIIKGELRYAHDPVKKHKSYFTKPILGQNVDFNLMKPSNKVRMYDYLNNLISAKTIRGDSFEGLISALYNGEISKDKSSKYDITVENKNKKLSVKFINNIDERPVLGNIKTNIDKFIRDLEFKKLILPGQIDSKASLNDILKQLDNIPKQKKSKEYQFKLLNKSFSDVDYFLIAFPVIKDNESENDLKNIKCYLFNREFLIDRYIYGSDVRYAPKQKGSYQIRVNVPKLLEGQEEGYGFKSWYLISPTITESDFEYLNVSDVDVARKLFGSDKDRIRGSILNAIVNYGDFKEITLPNGDKKEYFIFDFDKYKKERGH